MVGRVYVSNLPSDIRRSELKDLFDRYGPVYDVDIKIPPRGTGVYAFVEMEDPRDADDAVRRLDGRDFGGDRLRVEHARSSGPRGGGGGGGPRGGGGGGRGGGGRTGGRGRPEARVFVYDLPRTASWQDLKDHMRKAGDVDFVDVYMERNGKVGIVEYFSADDARYAVKKLDGTDFKNPFDASRITVTREEKGRGRSRSRSPRRRSRSRSRASSYDSRRKSRSPAKRSRSPSPRKARASRSPSRSPRRSRSPPRVSRSKSRSPSPRKDRASRSKSPAKSPARNSRSRSRSRSRSPARSD